MFDRRHQIISILVIRINRYVKKKDYVSALKYTRDLENRLQSMVNSVKSSELIDAE